MNGEQLKLTGMTRSMDKTLARDPEWMARAINELRDFCMREKGAGLTWITIEDFRSAGFIEEPASTNTWGSIPRIAMKRNILRPTNRFIKATRDKAHSRMVRIWEII